MLLMGHELTIGALCAALVSILGWVVRSGLSGLRKAIEANTTVVSKLLTMLTVQEERVLGELRGFEKDHKRHEDETREVLRGMRRGEACEMNPVIVDKLSRAADQTLKNHNDD